MLQKIILGIAIFLIVMLGLTFGEAIFTYLASYLGFLFHDFISLMKDIQGYLMVHWGKALIALADHRPAGHLDFQEQER